MQYLLPKEFEKRYPLTKQLLGSGVYGWVYKSTIFAVKKFKTLRSFMIEINNNSLLDHPCILKPLAWTFTDDYIGYIAMPLGINLEKAFKKKLISLKQIIFDTLSAIAYLNKLNIINDDIKLENIIYHNDKAKLIDFGQMKKGKKSDMVLDLAYDLSRLGPVDWLIDKAEQNIPVDQLLPNT